MGGSPRPTGLVISNNLMMIGVLEALRRRRIRVPGDLALVSMDDPFWTGLTSPALTTMAQPGRDMAEAAVTLLFERIAGQEREPKVLRFPFELRIRDSCGARLPGAWRCRAVSPWYE